MNIEKFLANNLLFKQLSASQIEHIANLVEVRIFGKNDSIFIDGQIANCFYIVYSGSVKVFKLSIQGKEHVLHIMHPTDIVAEVPMFQGEHYPANCIALEKSILLKISRDKLINLIKEEPQIALNMLALQAKRLREFTMQIENLSTKDTAQRLAQYILEKGQMVDGIYTLDLEISLTALANLLGVTRENLSRTVSKLLKSNYIEYSDKQIKLLHLENMFLHKV